MSKIKYNKLVAPDTPIGMYLEYSKNSETPHAYDFWTALWLLSVTVGRSIVVDRPGAPVYLNMYCVLVAESGITRKSTAVRRAVKFARAFTDETTPLIEAKVTTELLEHRLTMQSLEHGYAYTNIAIDELVKFLGREKYVETMPTLLTDLYDSPAIRSGGGTLSRGKTLLKNVYINFLSASTPSWLLRAVNPDVIEGGFTSRVIFVVAETPKQSSPWPEPADASLFDTITSKLLSIKELASNYETISISPAAKARFSSWYRSRDKKRDSFRSSFQSREDSHILRVAALLSINDGIWEIQVSHLSSAIKLVIEAREDGATIFEGTGTNNKLVLGLDALRDKLITGGMSGIKQSDLTKSLQRYMTAAELKTGLAIMHELDMVQKFEDIQVSRGRPVTIWRATSALVDSKALDKIIAAVGP